MNQLKPIIFLLSVLLLSQKMIGQKETSIWYFGSRAGLNFNSSPPQPLTDGDMYNDEGTGVATTKDGRLLFYTNGREVYNRNHVIMPNGNGLTMNATSAQGTIIIPKPADSNIYYVFSVDGAERYFLLGYRYSEVDMRLNNGLGDVTAQKNVLLHALSTERIAAVKHANGVDYWVITKELQTNRFLVYKVTCNGVDPTPVITSIGSLDLFDIGSLGGVGIMKVSPDGSKIAFTTRYPDPQAELFDFNTATGQLSNAMVLPMPMPDPEYIYGLEFSPNSNRLYVANGIQKRIYQYDIISNNEAAINASRYVLDLSALNSGPYAMQMASDGKIYVVDGFRPHMSVINNPDIPGAGCNVTIASLDLGIRQNVAGLPAFVASVFDKRPAIDFSFNSVDCYLSFTGSTRFINNSARWQWDFGDGKKDTGQTVRHSYTRAGNFNVALTVVLMSPCGPVDSFTISKPVSVFNVFAIDFAGAGNCVGENFQFNDSTILTVGNITGWSWDFGDGNGSGLQNPIHRYNAAGVYDVKFVVSTSGICRADSIVKKVYIDTKPIANFIFADGCVNQSIFFTDASTNLVGAPIKWLWRWGDGNSDSVRNTSHRYATGKSYAVRLSTSSEHGCTGDTLKNVIIEDIPVADFSQQGVCLGENTIFIDLSAIAYGRITKWNWNFGDNSTANIKDPMHIYPSPGNYKARLQVQTEYGCSSIIKEADVIIKKVIANAGKDSFAIYDQPYQLQGSGGDSYLWTPSTGLSNTGIPSPIAKIKNDITYILKATSIEGCFDYDTVNLKVYTNFDIFVPNAFTPNGDGKNDYLTPVCRGIKSLSYFRVFNRWGQLVFSTNEMGKGWDGRINNSGQLGGTYVWVVGGEDIFGKKVEHRGVVMLIK